MHKIQPIRLPYLGHVIEIDQWGPWNFEFCLIIEIFVSWPPFGSRDLNTVIWLVEFFPFFLKKNFSFHFINPLVIFSHPLCVPCLTSCSSSSLSCTFVHCVCASCLPFPLCVPSILILFDLFSIFVSYLPVMFDFSFYPSSFQPLSTVPTGPLYHHY